jgi:hypothetical protein
LSRLRGAIVIAARTAFTLKDKQVDLKQLGVELGVRYALEGSVLRSEESVRIEGDDELLPDRLGLFVGTGRKHHGEARVIVEHGQRMKPASVQGDVPLKSICHNSFGRARSNRVKAD